MICRHLDVIHQRSDRQWVASMTNAYEYSVDQDWAYFVHCCCLGFIPHRDAETTVAAPIYGPHTHPALFAGG